MELKNLVFDAIKDIEYIANLNVYSLLSYPVDKNVGDVTLPCFSLAKSLRASPVQIAETIKNQLDKAQFARVESVNGYLNFYLDRIDVYTGVMKEFDKFVPPTDGVGKTVFVDFSSVNLAKYMHIGHLSTTVIGSVIANTLEYMGYKVIRLNYIGDYGTPFGKMITAIKRWGDEKDISAKGVDYIQDMYVRFNVESENDPTLIDEARSWFARIEQGEPEANRVYKLIIDTSLVEVKRLCDTLGITFDSWRGESYYNDKMDAVVDQLQSKGLLQTSEGAQIVDLEPYKLGVCMIKKSDGSSLYSTRDLSAVADRYNLYKFDLGLYVTSVQQKLHFERVFKVLELMGKDYAQSCKHIYYGTYSLPTGKIGSRFGKQALVKDMLEISIAKAKEVITTRGTASHDIDNLATSIGIGAVKFGVLKTERVKDCVFDLENSLNFDGETSPYMQYTFARACSIISKATDLEFSQDFADIDNVDAFELIKELNKFSKTIRDSANDFEPCYISRYLLELCSLFNKFYNNYRIIDNQMVSMYRLRLVEAFRFVLGEGLKILGIQAPIVM